MYPGVCPGVCSGVAPGRFPWVFPGVCPGMCPGTYSWCVLALTLLDLVFSAQFFFYSVAEHNQGFLCSKTDWQEGRVSTGRSAVIPSACSIALLELLRLQGRSAHGICTALACKFFQASIQQTIPVGMEEILLPAMPISGCQRSVVPLSVKASHSS